MSKRDYYEVLGVGKNATDKEIKTAYRKLAKKYHPDTAGDSESSKKRFEEIGEAYAILSDAKKRKMYDTYGFAAFENGDPSESNNGDSYSDPGGYRHYYSHFTGSPDNMDDIFGDIFGSMFGNSHSSQRRNIHFDYDDYADGGFFTGNTPFESENASALDIHSDIDVSFDDAALGAEKRVKLREEGGKIITLQVHIPAGIEDGKSIRLKGKGNRSGSKTGDLYLKVHVSPKDGFDRKGADIYTVARVPFSTAVLGGEIKVETIHGQVMCAVPAGMQSGCKIRLKNKGVPVMGKKGLLGDHYVTIEVIVPKNLSKQASQKLREFEELAG